MNRRAPSRRTLFVPIFSTPLSARGAVLGVTPNPTFNDIKPDLSTRQTTREPIKQSQKLSLIHFYFNIPENSWI